MKTASILLAAMVSAFSVHANSISCLPSDLGGSGSVMVTSTNKVGKWVGWWCPGESLAHIFACRTASCPTGSALAAKFQRLWDYPNPATLNEMVYALPNAGTLADVWKPELPKLLAVKPK